MRDHSEKILRLVCLALAGLLCYQISRVVVRKDPFQQLNIPSVLKMETLSEAPKDRGAKTNSTNSTNSVSSTNVSTSKPTTNLTVATNVAATNAAALNSTNLVIKPTNAFALTTNISPRGSMPPIRGMAGPVMGRGGPQIKLPDLPPPIQTRVDRIVQSEILGTIVRPMPMALLGIAGKDAFVRTSTGQTGLLREGEELGGIKLLKIGTNRILIEHESQKKELTVFSGFGSETLLSKEKESN
jgi:hypothetical protein